MFFLFSARYLKNVLCVAAFIVFSAHLAKAEEMANEGNVKIHNGVLRISSETNRASGFFVIENSSNNDRLLQDITSTACQDIVANHSNQEPINRGHDVQKNIFKNLVIPQHSVMVFPEGGYHFVCHGLNKNIKTDEKATFVFHFDENQNIMEEFQISTGK